MLQQSAVLLAFFNFNFLKSPSTMISVIAYGVSWVDPPRLNRLSGFMTKGTNLNML